ncbi:hypothetical protein OBBRIDRAFT_813845 [Obba rivulosa]|uniref:Fatty acid desaturase domain-containing protein n=1 Tax=Obba rivulosa TaxID=1052685 RepID=A0A8E2ANN5_9APHY|nr:hypothetical protein OBBRIDRAFT_813845 [Obba rivulosa]
MPREPQDQWGANPKYNEALLPEFSPLNWRIRKIRAAIPPRLFVQHMWIRKLTLMIDPLYTSEQVVGRVRGAIAECARWTTWMVIGYECGHGAFLFNKVICDFIGYISGMVVHTLLQTAYFSWKISHHRHHRNHAVMERNEVYVPKIRSNLGIPREHEVHQIDYEEYLRNTLIYTLYMLIRQQILAFPAYLLFNVSANSILFSLSQRDAVIASNCSIISMVCIVWLSSMTWGGGAVLKYYGIPFIIITYLHHTDPKLPHYRNAKWNFQRDAAATVDRDFLGWMGHFFLHDVAHFHIIHHFFLKMLFYHGPEATEHLKAFIGTYYRCSTKPVFRALWDNYNNCQFVDDDGDIVFYCDRRGRDACRPTHYKNSI